MSLYSRRSAMKLSAAAVAVPLFLPSRLSGNDGKLNIGVIGIGGRGRSDLAAVSTETIAAVCDVDEQRLAAVAKQHPNARTYHDYRQLLDQERPSNSRVLSVQASVQPHGEVPDGLERGRSHKPQI